MVLTTVKCPYCKSDDIVKNGKRNGTQIYMCRNKDCPRTTFSEVYKYKAYEPNVKEKIFDMTVNGSGTRATARVLGIAPNTVTAALKKKKD